MSEEFRKWWMKEGSKIWAVEVEKDILKAIEIVFKEGYGRGSVDALSLKAVVLNNVLRSHQVEPIE